MSLILLLRAKGIWFDREQSHSRHDSSPIRQLLDNQCCHGWSDPPAGRFWSQLALIQVHG